MEKNTKNKRKKRKLTRFEHFILYILIRFVVFLVLLFPVNTSLKFANFLGGLVWKYYKRGRLRALENLKASFPEKDDNWISNVGKRSVQQLVMLVMDVLYTPKLVKKENWRQYSRFIDCEYPKWLIKEHKGAILITGHYGNFEIVGYMLGLFGFDIYSIARPLDNPYFNNYLYGIRQKMGQKILNKKGVSNEFDDILKSGATLGIIADQDAGKKGVFVDFFGRKASAYKSIAIAALYYNVPIIVGVSRRVDNNFFFELKMEKIIFPKDWTDKEDPIYWITQEYTKALENAIRQDPTQYWWIHRRWKTRPKNERL